MSESVSYRDGNRIVISGLFSIAELQRPLANLHNAVNRAGFQDVLLDFRDCTAAFAGPMLGLCAQVLRMREARVDFDLILPTEPKLARLFTNANWAHLIAPRNFPESSFKGMKQIPATRFEDPKEQNQAVNRIVNTILGAIPDIERPDFAALEWSINEVTDNVLVHSESKIGGLVQVSTFQRNRKRLEYIVADAGAGIPATLRATHREITSDIDALDLAIREGVTRDSSIGQGNGLFGSYQICSRSKGMLEIDSGYAKLRYTDSSGLHLRRVDVPYDGTLVVAQIDFSIPGLLQEALQFGGKIHRPIDTVEMQYERDGLQEVLVELKREAPSFGSRLGGTPLRIKLKNLARMCPDQKICIDFADVPVISSSFADEVFGKLFLEIGPLAFMRRFEFRNVSVTAQQLMDKAIAQRAATGLGV